MKIVLITPPFTQTNTPYPATAYLQSFLKGMGHEVNILDLGVDVLDCLFSSTGLERVAKVITDNKKSGPLLEYFLDALSDYQRTITPVMNFLRGRDTSLSQRIVARNFLPEGPRFLNLDQYSDQIFAKFGEMATHDFAKYLCSLYLDDLADIIKEGVDSEFGFSRYGESLASSQHSFNPLYLRLKTNSLIDQILFEQLEKNLELKQADIIGLSIPFPGNLLSGLKIGEWVRKLNLKASTVMGGGYVNTELKRLTDPRIFEFIDFLFFDDGEAPLISLIEMLEGKKTKLELVRAKFVENGKVVDSKNQETNISFKQIPAPDYTGLNDNKYFSMIEMPNTMNRMWSDHRWNKMILAHGCYWKKCTFCDTSLDYISRFEPQKASIIVDYIEKIVSETGITGFHFVDEAAPPALIKEICHEIIKRNLTITWWGNLRFDSMFSLELTQMMSDAGCVAVTGGVEVASARILKLINKGIDISKISKVTKNFSDSNIFVHAYLMYGFPSQTLQETIDSLETVRLLFLNGSLNSAFWHRFAATIYSDVGLHPEKYGVKLDKIVIPSEGLFSINEIGFTDLNPNNCQKDLDVIGRGLRKALYNYMHGIGLDEDVRAWFEIQVPKPSKIKL